MALTYSPLPNPDSVGKCLIHPLSPALSPIQGERERDEYLFAPSREPLVREAGSEARDWDGGRPLSVDELHYLVKLHAGRAGLKADKITCQTLRNTAAMRIVEAGGTPEAVQVLLGRESAGGTKKYLRRLAKPPHVHVTKSGNGAKFWLDPIKVEREGRFRKSDLRDIERIIEDNHDFLLKAWEKEKSKHVNG